MKPLRFGHDEVELELFDSIMETSLIFGPDEAKLDSLLFSHDDLYDLAMTALCFSRDGSPTSESLRFGHGKVFDSAATISAFKP